MSKDKTLLGRKNAKSRALLVGSRIADVQAMEDLLINMFGYGPKDIHVCSAMAKSTEIVSEPEKMVEGAKPGDQRIFYFSGHGVQMKSEKREGICRD